MFLKRCARRKAGKKHVYWQLVESYRVRGGCRHRMVAYLGLVLGRMLGLDELFERELERGKEDVPWAVTASRWATRCSTATARM